MTPAAADDPVPELLARERFGIKLGLDNILALCDALDRPELACPSVIVAGTNGKGSVAAMVSTALTAAGYRTARYTSPHLVHLEERFAIDGAPVSPERLRHVLRVVLDAEASCRRDGRLQVPATFFELTTATAFALFRSVGAEFAVLEVGLGGRLDATNVARPLAAAITTIDLDHTAHLGPTISAIAAEKAGIMKPGLPVVYGERKPEAVTVFRLEASRAGATLIDAFEGVDWHLGPDAEATTLDLTTPARSYGCIRLALRGRHQAANAVVATRLLETLEARGLAIGSGAIGAGLSTARWPGRLDLVTLPGGRGMLLDAAHNPAGAVSLAAYLREAWRGKVPLVFGAMGDKDVEGVIAALVPVASRFVFTRPGTPRAMPPAALAALLGRIAPGVPATADRSVPHALDEAFATSPRIVVTGSIFLVGEALTWARAAATPPAGAAAEGAGDGTAL